MLTHVTSCLSNFNGDEWGSACIRSHEIEVKLIFGLRDYQHHALCWWGFVCHFWESIGLSYSWENHSWLNKRISVTVKLDLSLSVLISCDSVYQEYFSVRTCFSCSGASAHSLRVEYYNLYSQPCSFCSRCMLTCFICSVAALEVWNSNNDP